MSNGKGKFKVSETVVDDLHNIMIEEAVKLLIIMKEYKEVVQVI